VEPSTKVFHAKTGLWKDHLCSVLVSLFKKKKIGAAMLSDLEIMKHPSSIPLNDYPQGNSSENPTGSATRPAPAEARLLSHKQDGSADLCHQEGSAWLQPDSALISPQSAALVSP